MSLKRKLINRIMEDENLSEPTRYSLFLECQMADDYPQKYKMDALRKIQTQLDNMSEATAEEERYNKKRKIVMERINKSGEDDREKKILDLKCSPDNLDIIYKKYLQYLKLNNHENGSLDGWLTLVLSLPHDSPQKIFPFIKTKAPQKIEKMRSILNENIYGQEVVKDKLLKWLVKYTFSPKGSVRNLALLGEPGNGKTLFASSIAKCINFPFYDINLSTADRLTISGLNFSFKDSQESRITSAMAYFYERSRTRSGVLFFDELDKASSKVIFGLLQITDPTFKTRYKDDFLSGITQDLSGVLMIFAMNHKIEEGALDDRIETVDLEKYTLEEKFHIIKNFFLPNQIKNLNLNKDSIILSDECIKLIVNQNPENSIRTLENKTKKIIDSLYYIFLNQKEERGVNLTENSIQASENFILSQLCGKGQVQNDALFSLYS